jgi:hypothetical protein
MRPFVPAALNSPAAAVEAWNFGHGLAGYSLQVANQADRRLDHGQYLRFALCPMSAHELALSVEILAHVAKLLDDRFHSLSKLDPDQILVDLLHLGLFAPVEPGASRAACDGDVRALSVH